MLRDVFRSAGDIEMYGLISMIIFIAFFALLLMYAISLGKEKAEDFSRMPFDDYPDKPEEEQDC